MNNLHKVELVQAHRSLKFILRYFFLLLFLKISHQMQRLIGWSFNSETYNVKKQHTFCLKILTRSELFFIFWKEKAKLYLFQSHHRIFCFIRNKPRQFTLMIRIIYIPGLNKKFTFRVLRLQDLCCISPIKHLWLDNEQRVNYSCNLLVCIIFQQ